VQRSRSAGKEDDRQREQRQQASVHSRNVGNAGGENQTARPRRGSRRFR
jgi:hypothetical protein